jgi:2-polyprenyl-3-methyl-5-hydroxy-6-metoxy-1,4-benzoquinol methylase
MNHNFNNKEYWENRLHSNLTLQGTGHRGFDLEYNRWMYKAQRECMDEILQKHNIDVAGKNVLDIGSGSGFYVEYFLDHGASSITGVDITQASKRYLQEQFPTGTFITADISETDLPLQSHYNIISAMGVLYHIIDDQKFQHAIRNLCSRLATGGIIFITDSFVKPILPSAKHACFRPLKDYLQVLEPFNIDVVDLIPLYYLSNRTIIPVLGPKILSVLKSGKWFHHLDKKLREANISNGSNLKILIVQKGVDDTL